jgi:hypothetical protein
LLLSCCRQGENPFVQLVERETANDPVCNQAIGRLKLRDDACGFPTKDAVRKALSLGGCNWQEIAKFDQGLLNDHDGLAPLALLQGWPVQRGLLEPGIIGKSSCADRHWYCFLGKAGIRQMNASSSSIVQEPVEKCEVVHT